MAIARFTLAVDRRFKRDGEPSADFINIVCFGKTAEFVERYVRKDSGKIAVYGRIQTGSYTNKDGARVYTTDVVAEEVEFGGSKSDNGNATNNAPAKASKPAPASAEGFMNIPDGLDEELPFN